MRAFLIGDIIDSRTHYGEGKFRQRIHKTGESADLIEETDYRDLFL